MVFGYCAHFGLKAEADKVRAEALEWATTRGARSGRTAWQFIQDLAADFEVQLRAADIAGLARIADHLAASDEVVLGDHQAFGMSIGGGVAAAMLDQDQIAVPLQLVAGIGDGTRRAGMDRRAHGGGDIDAVILAAAGGGAEIGDHTATDRPSEGRRAAGRRKRLGGDRLIGRHIPGDVIGRRPRRRRRILVLIGIGLGRIRLGPGHVAAVRVLPMRVLASQVSWVSGVSGMQPAINGVTSTANATQAILPI
jgi:hypothetical protein